MDGPSRSDAILEGANNSSLTFSCPQRIDTVTHGICTFMGGGYKDNDAIVQYSEDKIVKKVDMPY
jgi:radical SAM superfamily enzyme